ncbi:MAG: aminotransferase class III-fold pyridoxal phosphate-dependent enzyme, partial [Promethearchaeota archaeon]
MGNGITPKNMKYPINAMITIIINKVVYRIFIKLNFSPKKSIISILSSSSGEPIFDIFCFLLTILFIEFFNCFLIFEMKTVLFYAIFFYGNICRQSFFIMFIKKELKQYIESRPKSKKEWEKAIRVLPGGISHNIRTFELNRIGAFPPIIKSAKGAYITDIDNNKYIDCWMGHFAMIIGHNHPEVLIAIKQQLERGWHLGVLTDLQINLAEMIINDNPGIEMLRFCTSGTEATMYATRLARAYTNRKLIAKALLGWHGANDTLYYGVGTLNKDQIPPGLRPPTDAGILTYEINTNEIFDLIASHSKDLAAVILEPMLGGGGGFRADLEFLKRLREETEKHGILLIFDEVITGYRFRNSLFQNELKIIPDLTTMGKIIGGGLPIGAIGGRKDIIERSRPLSENQILIGGGTFSGYPLSMAAGMKT